MYLKAGYQNILFPFLYNYTILENEGTHNELKILWQSSSTVDFLLQRVYS